MQIFILLESCELLLGQARAETMNENGAEAKRNLVKLRELLNSQTELEAGGGDRRCRVCNRANADLFISGHTWVLLDLCSMCERKELVKMTTQELISKIAECLAVVDIEHRKQGDKVGEEFLRRLQLLWNQERPLVLSNQN